LGVDGTLQGGKGNSPKRAPIGKGGGFGGIKVGYVGDGQTGKNLERGKRERKVERM